MTTFQRLEIAPRGSRFGLAVWVAAVAGVAAGLWMLVLPWWLRVPLLLGLLAGGSGVFWPRATQPALLWDGSAWRLLRSDAADAVGDFRWDFVSRWLVVASFREKRWRRYRPVFADAVAPEVFRALLVVARGAVSARS